MDGNNLIILITCQVDHCEHGVQVQFEELPDLLHELMGDEKVNCWSSSLRVKTASMGLLCRALGFAPFRQPIIPCHVHVVDMKLDTVVWGYSDTLGDWQKCH